MPKWILQATLAILVLASLSELGLCIVSTGEGGKWPKDWPAELESLRASAKTIDVACGTQEHIYEIEFASNDEFMKMWPALLRVRTPGSPLRLQGINTPKAGSWESIASNSAPKVRIYAPVPTSNHRARIADYGPDGPTVGKQPKMLPYKTGPPWPADLTSANGELPEYVQAIPRDGKAMLVAVKQEDKPRGFQYRARVDIELVVDGKVVNLNRIEFPKDAQILDRRFEADAPK